MGEPVFTIGHSTRTIEEFVALLAANGVRRVVDVRTVPRSRTNPQYNKDALPKSLAGHGIAYEHIAALGGLLLAAYLSYGFDADVAPGATIVLLSLAGFALTWPVGIWLRSREVARA